MPVTPTPPENFSMGRPACSGTTAHEAESGSLPALWATLVDPRRS